MDPITVEETLSWRTYFGVEGIPHSSTNGDRDSRTSLRINRELAAIRCSDGTDESPNMISVGLMGENLYHWQAVIIGPMDTPYEDGAFSLSIHIPFNYPTQPPRILFITPIFHPNIDSSGRISLDLLGGAYCPALTIQKLLLCVQALLSDPAFDNPLVPEIARDYKADPEIYLQKARQWTTKYAI